jgi:Iap family predicted aminopeptidase
LGFLCPSTGNFVAFVGNLGSRSLVKKTLTAFRGTRALPSLGAAVPNAIPGAGWSDHWSFWQQGFPGIEITDTALYRNPYYHTPGDTPDRLDYDRMARFAQAMKAVVERIADLKPAAVRTARLRHNRSRHPAHMAVKWINVSTRYLR